MLVAVVVVVMVVVVLVVGASCGGDGEETEALRHPQSLKTFIIWPCPQKFAYTCSEGLITRCLEFYRVLIHFQGF